MSKHTPGPWTVTMENRGAIPEHFRPYSILDASGERIIARLPDGRAPEDTSNACLIAAAPQMLKALETILNEFDRQDPTPGFVLAMAAIKAARGE